MPFLVVIYLVLRRQNVDVYVSRRTRCFGSSDWRIVQLVKARARQVEWCYRTFFFIYSRNPISNCSPEWLFTSAVGCWENIPTLMVLKEGKFVSSIVETTPYWIRSKVEPTVLTKELSVVYYTHKTRESTGWVALDYHQRFIRETWPVRQWHCATNRRRYNEHGNKISFSFTVSCTIHTCSVPYHLSIRQ